MGAKKRKSKTYGKQIENHVQEQLQSALSGDFFQSIFDMREQQMNRAKQIQEQTKEWSDLSFWNVPNTRFDEMGVPNVQGAHTDLKTESGQSEDEVTEHMATDLENQIQAFVRHVLAMSLPDK